MGPGKVHLTVTRGGRWLEFTPSWNGGRALFSLGGISLYAKGPDGNLTEFVNTKTGDIHVSENASRFRRSCEGRDGGSRAPSPDPDDDHDGRIDEDRLDGIDNDADGRVDEDYSGIGDEMVATCYFAPGIDGGGAQLAFHQETYAWSLPHIDGTIMVSLWVKNIGAKPLEDVRVGASFDKEGPFYFSNWVVSLPDEPGARHASIVVCEDLQGTNVGLVVFPGDKADGGLWTGGVVEGPEDASTVLLDRLIGEGPGGSPDGRMPNSRNGSPYVSVVKSKETRIGEKSTVYQVSPGLGELQPGDEVRLDLALFAVCEKTDVESAAITTVRTFAGDGKNRYLPPPLSMTPRVLWGSYYLIENGESEGPRVAVEFEALGEDRVTPGEISYFSGIDPAAVDRVEVEPGVERLVFHRDALEKRLRKGERIIIKGRLESGEFFEAVLRPREGSIGSAEVADDTELFWNTEGRLEVELLASSPNPFRDNTTIYYEIPGLIEEQGGARIETKEPIECSVKVYSVVGRLVSVLVEDVLPPGTYTTQWRAVDDQGSPVASGVYYVRFQIGKKFITQRLILLK